MALGGENDEATPEASVFMQWVEHGVFDALKAGYLERAVVVLSHDEAAKQRHRVVGRLRRLAHRRVRPAVPRPPGARPVLHTPPHPALHPALHSTPPPPSTARPLRRATESDSQAALAQHAVPCAAPVYTLDKVRDTSQMMMRSLITTLQWLPQLPSQHFISMRILYRESTPDE